MTFDEIIDFRASNRKFDPEVPVPAEVIEKALKHATLAPNSSNMQLWEFHWTKSPEAKAKMVEACLSQMARMVIAFGSVSLQNVSTTFWIISAISQNRRSCT